MIEQLLRDLLYGARQLRRQPAFAAIAVLSLALGIGANAAIFSVIRAVLLSDPPYAAPERLVTLTQSMPALGEGRLGTSAPEYLDYRDRNRAFASIAGYARVNVDVTDRRGQEAERIEAVRVTASLFQTLGVAPLVGSTFTSAAETPAPEPGTASGANTGAAANARTGTSANAGTSANLIAGRNANASAGRSADAIGGADRVVVLGYDYWMRRHAGDPHIIGSTLLLDERPFTVVGVMQPGFEFPATTSTVGDPPALWIPLAFTPRQIADRAASFDTRVVARLAPGVTIDRARQDIARIAEDMQREHADIYRGNVRLRASVDPFHAESHAKARPVLIVLAAAVACVLLTACANVANLLLGRASARQREMAVRRALGAGTGRIVRQLLAESVLLSGLGGAIGCLLAIGMTRVAATLWPDQILSLRGVRVDGLVLAFTLGLLMLTGVLCGLAPALAARGGHPGDALKHSARTIGAGRDRRRFRRALVIVEAAGAVVLLVGAGLLIHSFVKVVSVPLGFDPNQVLIVRAGFSRERYPGADARHHAQRAIVDRLKTIPGARAVALATHIPLADERQIGIAFERDVDAGPFWADNALVSGDYFAAMGIPLLRGRTFTDDDTPNAPMVAIVNHTFARRYFADREPIGERFIWGGRRLTVVGIAGDVHLKALDADVEPMVYCPVYQIESGATVNAVFLIRFAANDGVPSAAPNAHAAPSMPAGARAVTIPTERMDTHRWLALGASSARAAIRAVDPGLAVFDTRPMAQIVARSLASRRFLIVLLTAFAGLALVLATIGLYAVLAHAVTQRIQELGLRLALGARPGELLTLVIGDALRLVAAGLTLGLLAATALGSTMSSLLFRVERFDPATFVAATVLLLTVSLAASYIPARRASRVDPMTALRSE